MQKCANTGTEQCVVVTLVVSVYTATHLASGGRVHSMHKSLTGYCPGGGGAVG